MEVELVFHVMEVELVFHVLVEDVEDALVELVDGDVCAVAVDNAGYASSTAMMAMVDAVIVAVFANLVMFEHEAMPLIFT
jgi:hypothetical protein